MRSQCRGWIGEKGYAIKPFLDYTISGSSNTHKKESTVQSTSVSTKASVWYDVRVLWAKINHVKSHAMTLAFCHQTDMNQIF